MSTNEPLSYSEFGPIKGFIKEYYEKFKIFGHNCVSFGFNKGENLKLNLIIPQNILKSTLSANLKINKKHYYKLAFSDSVMFRSKVPLNDKFIFRIDSFSPYYKGKFEETFLYESKVAGGCVDYLVNDQNMFRLGFDLLNKNDNRINLGFFNKTISGILRYTISDTYPKLSSTIMMGQSFLFSLKLSTFDYKRDKIELGYILKRYETAQLLAALCLVNRSLLLMGHGKLLRDDLYGFFDINVNMKEYKGSIGFKQTYGSSHLLLKVGTDKNIFLNTSFELADNIRGGITTNIRYPKLTDVKYGFNLLFDFD